MPPIPKLSDFPQGGRVALPGFSAPELHDRATATIAATRGQYPPFPVAFPVSGAAADDAGERARAALPPTRTSTPARAATPAEEAFAARPDAAAVVAAKVDRAQRMMAAGASDEAERIRRESRTANADEQIRLPGIADAEQGGK